MSHNESLADQIIEGSAESVNGDGTKFSGLEFNKDETGLAFRLAFTNRQILIGTAALVAGVLLKKNLNGRTLAVNTAQKVQDVAEQAEEAASRG